jgi:hypothetical protein
LRLIPSLGGLRLDPVSETFFSLVSRIPVDGQSPRTHEFSETFHRRLDLAIDGWTWLSRILFLFSPLPLLSNL